MAHEMDYEELTRILPKNVVPSYDGMVIELSHENIASPASITSLQ